MQYKEIAVGGTVYFWFAANLTTGSAGDGATPLYDVRLAGAASNAAPTASGTPTLLSHANYTDGLHEIAVDSTGYAQGEYAVFCTLTISTVNPAGFVGSFLVTAASSTSRDLLSAIKTKTDFLPSATAGAAGGLFIAGSNAATSITTALTANVIGNITGNLSGSVGSATLVNGLAANVITAASMAADAGAEIADAVWDEDATGHQTQGTFGQAIGDPAADTNTIYKAVVTDATGVNVAADVVALKAETVSILADTNELQTDWVNGGRLDLILDIIAADTTTDIPALIATLQAFVNTEVAEILADTNELQTDWANGGRLDLILDARASQTSVDDIPTNAESAEIVDITDAMDTIWGTAWVSAGTCAGLITALSSAVTGFFRLLMRKDAAVATDNADELTVINADEGSGPGTFDNTDDSTQAIADGAGGGGATAEEVADEVETRALILHADYNAAKTAATQASVNTVDTVVDAIKVKTDSLTFTQAGNVDANVQMFNNVALTGDGSSGDKFDVA